MARLSKCVLCIARVLPAILLLSSRQNKQFPMILQFCFRGKTMTHLHPFDLRSWTNRTRDKQWQTYDGIKEAKMSHSQRLICTGRKKKEKNRHISTEKGSITYNPSAIHSNFKSSPLTSSFSELTPEGIRIEGLLSRIALAEEVQHRVRAFQRNQTCDVVYQRVCI